MKVIKAFGNDHTFYTLPPYDGSHHGNIRAWIQAVSEIRHSDRKLHNDLIRKIIDFRDSRSNEIEIMSTLLRQNFKYDVRVIWRRSEVTLHMYSLKTVEHSQEILQDQ